MRRLEWLLCAVAVLALDAGASVHIPRPKVAMAAPEEIGEMTGGRTLVGCTTFREVALICDCKEEGGSWKLAAVARAIPYVYLSNIQFLRHELLHIFDFRQYLGQHVKSLGAIMFATRKACDAHAMAAALAFPDTMKKITRLSSARRDGRQGYSLEDHLVVVKAEVVPKLVNDRVANLADSVPPAAGEAEDRPAKDSDLVGQDGEHVKAAISQSDPAVDAKQLVVLRTVAKRFEVFVGRFLLDNDDNVIQQPGKLVRQLFQSFLYEVLELKTS